MTRHISPQDVLPNGVDALPEGAPTIAVVVSLNIPQMSDEVADIVVRFTRAALQELTDLGARVRLVDSSLRPLPDRKLTGSCDGVLFLGGGDIDPDIYDNRIPVANLYGVDRDADEFSIDIIRSTIERDAPLLCICRGSQLLNVALGGDLIPDIEDVQHHHGQKGEPMFTDESVTLVPGSKVHSILGRDRVTVRAGHHQAVRRVAEGLIVTARADDGMVEGTELPHARWVVGVQWHPEDDDGSADDRRALFSAFINEVRRLA